jgi:hypothetical protein
MEAVLSPTVQLPHGRPIDLLALVEVDGDVVRIELDEMPELTFDRRELEAALGLSVRPITAR